VTVLCSTILAVGCALSVDLGRAVVINRSLQSAADLAALDGVANITGTDSCTSSNALTQAAKDGAENNSDASYAPSEGYWNSSTGTFTACGTPLNAIKVVATQSLPNLFVSGTDTLSRTGIAALPIPPAATCSASCYSSDSSDATFTIGTFLASLSTQQMAGLDGLLGALTPGSSVNLTTVGYQGLVSSNVTLQGLINASGGVLTTSNVLTASISPGSKLLSYLSTALTNEGTASAAVTQLAAIITDAGAPTSVKLCQLISVGGSTCSSGTLSPSALTSNINVLQLMTTDADLANQSSAAGVSLGLSLPGVLTTTLKTSLIEPPQEGYGAPGSATATASTAQVTSTLTMCLAMTLGVCVTSVKVPISAADGTATLTSVNCSTSSTPTNVVISAGTTTVSTAIGLTLAGLTLASIPITVAGVSPNDSLTFTPTYSIADYQTIGNPGGAISIGSSPTGGSLINTLLSSLTTSLGPLLQALGVNVGGANIAVTGAGCTAVVQ
jgi:uncharacterized membrane protein